VLADYPASVVARISGARPGVIYDAIWDDEACRRLWSLFQSQGTLSARRGTFRASPALPGDTPTDVEAVPKITRGAGEQTNTNVVIGDRYMLKIFRRLEPGVNPDVEIGRYLARRPDVRVPRLMGSLDYQEPSGQAATMAMVQRLVASQWGGWEHAVAEVRQYLEGVEIRVRTGEPPPEMPASALDDAIGGKQVPGEDEVGAYVSDLVTLARRTAELHLALASDGEDPAFFWYLSASTLSSFLACAGERIS
jgi:maltose alpha-D-glucosyltransferase/alpha-amylase